MNFVKKTRGAISVFLALIILPTVTIAGLFLDVSRTKLSQEVIVTSADLALNTVLSEYDKNLKDYFGLLASCQDTSDVIEVSKGYFVDSMVSAGVPTSAAGEYADSIISAFVGDTDISDMLSLSVDGETIITPTANGALNNPALIKKEIIEFMKYRAPVNGVEALFKKITDSEVEKQMENLSKETEMVNAKKKFYEAERKLIEQAEKAYEAIKSYQNYTGSANGKKITDESFLDDFSVFIASPTGPGKTMKEVFKEAHRKMVMDLYNTHDTDGTLVINLLKNTPIAQQSAVTTYSDENKADAGTIEVLLKQLNEAMADYHKKKSALDTDWNNVGAMQGSDYSIQYWVIVTNGCSSSYAAYVASAGNLWKVANKLENAVEYAADGAMAAKMVEPKNDYVTFETADENNQLSLESVYTTLITHFNGSLKGEATGGGCQSYKSVGSQLRNLDTLENAQKLELSSVNDIYNIRNTLNHYYNDFDKAGELAKTAEEETKELKKLLKKYKEAFEEWKRIANDSQLEDSELAKKDRDEIAKLEETGIEHFSEASVTELEGRLGKVKTLCQTFRDDIKAMKYKSTSLLDISGYTKFRSTAALDGSKITRNESSLQQYAEVSFSFSIGERIQRIIVRDDTTSETLEGDGEYVITDSFHTNLEKTELELLNWMKHKFDSPVVGGAVNKKQTGFDVTDKGSAKDADKAISKKSEDLEKIDDSGNLSGHSFSEWSGATLPSKGEGAALPQPVGAKIEEAGKFASDLFSNFSVTFKGSLVNMRDDLYMMDYLFSMFTYDTFENEGCYARLGENTPKNPEEAKGKYATVKGAWEDSTENKTLTLTPRNASNNWAYGGEIEYILYGNASDGDNKGAAYRQVYLIRYAMDVVAVFQFYWNDEILNSLARALEAFAFIPAPLTKTLACLAITAAEAAVDISYLKAGLPVVLLKGEDDLVCNYQSLFLGTSNGNPSSENRIALQYSDYLKIFLYIKLVGKDENLIYTRTADVIQSNMSLVTNNYAFDLAKAQVYFDLKASVLMEPMWSRFLAIDNLGDLSTQKGWRTTTVEIRRGY